MCGVCGHRCGCGLGLGVDGYVERLGMLLDFGFDRALFVWCFHCLWPCCITVNRLFDFSGFNVTCVVW